ncbi:nucleotidyltransferase domain-containing protein [Candidatus Woesearchaeota archaeon]|nr:nucleotidyltransferase domain-containing protein [Candidatus Woesearchaeota archaeon]
MSKKGKSLQPQKITKRDEKSVETTLPSAQKLPSDVEKKLQALKKKLDTFKERVLEKFGDYITGMTLLPPEKPVQPNGEPLPKEEKGERTEKAEKDAPKSESKEEKLQILVVVDDTTSQKMSKDELHQKFSTVVKKIAEEVDKNIVPQPILLTDLWLNCYDAKYDLNRLISMGAPIHDTGMLAAIKIAEIHKSMVIKKFEKYILSYVLAGSLTQGKATPTSDIDVWIVIDDTDVKKMSRAELKDKLRAIIIGMGIEAGEMTGIKNKLNIQVYILTDFWDSLKEANPIIFTLLRDGVPFYDRGIFMPWKQLLRMGRIKPSREAIDLFMSTGEQSITRVKNTLKTMGMEDTYYAILTPSQAAIMLYGLPPPTPRETPDVMEEIFVKKEKMLEPEYVKILKANVDLRKDIEHGTKKELSGTELDKYVQNAEKFLKRIRELFKEIEAKHDEKSILSLYDEIITIIRDVLKQEGIEKAQDEDILKLFEDELISTGKVPARYLRELNDIVDAKKRHVEKKLTKNDIEKARKGSSTLIKFLVEYLQRKRGRELEQAKIRVKYGEKKYGEVILLDKVAFVIKDIDAKDQFIEKAPINEDGSLGTLQKSSLEEFEKELAKIKIPAKVFIKEPIFEDLKNIFGRHVEVLMNY